MTVLPLGMARMASRGVTSVIRSSSRHHGTRDALAPLQEVKDNRNCTRGYTPRRHCAHHLISESPVVLRGKVSVRDVHDVDHAAVTFRPILDHPSPFL